MSDRWDEKAGSAAADKTTSASGADQQPWTVLRLLEWTTEFFKKRGSPSARLDAEILLAHARQCSRIELYTCFAEVPDEPQRVAFRELVRRRGEGMPVAQLVGFKEFYSLSFRVDESVLIPRPETEHLVIETLDRAKQLAGENRPLRIADIGTGSGAIAITLAKNLPRVAITAVDQSAAALKIAQWNVEKHQVQQLVTLVQSDLFSEVDPEIRFDIVCSNPPYVSEAEYQQLSPTIRNFEPRQALVSGPAGTEVIARLLREATDRIVPAGRLIIELSPMIADACEKMVDEAAQWHDLRFIKDLEGHRRILSVARTDDGS